MNPPKVKIPKVPKLSLEKLEMTCLFNSYPKDPIIATMKHCKGPALPKIDEKAITRDRAHLKAVVIVLL
jgi:hypothetical protein